MPKLDGLQVSQAQESDKPSAYVPVRYMVDLSGGEKPGVETTFQLPRLKAIVEKILKEAGPFRSYTFESFQAKDVDRVLQLEMTNYGSPGKAIAAGFITGITLFIIPSAATDNFKLTAKLFNANGQVLKSYSYDDAITTWFGIWLLPMAGHTPESAVMEVWENMIRTLVRDMLKDGLVR